MKKIFMYSCLFATLLMANCAGDKKEIKKEGPPDMGRNMFGVGIPRGLTLNSEGLAEGYVMFAVPNAVSNLLINRKGEVVHEWKGNYLTSHAYLQEDGSVFAAMSDPDFPTFGCCGPYGRIEKISWDGKILWDYEYAKENTILHHDFTVMPNGHILAIAYEVMPYAEAIAKGRKPELTPTDGPWIEKIIEIEPQGKTGGNIVWEWRISDHLIQNVDKTKVNYGNPVEHPELLDFNVGHPVPPPISQDSLDILFAKGMTHRNTTLGNRMADSYHFNSVKYNSDLDQIVMSSPSISEIFIIDHSTTTKEAASHKGGRAGKGGDFLFRWGNPKNYMRGDSTSRQLFGQHDVRWIEKGLPGEGHIMVFNNHPPKDIDWNSMGNKDKFNYSAIFELEVTPDKTGNYPIEKEKSFAPEKPVWKYIAPDTLSFFSSFISGAHRMANGNTFINEGAKGRFFEVTPDGKKVWEYLNPYHGNVPKTNGDPDDPRFMTFSEFRATFIPATHAAFKNKKLEPITPQPEVFKMPTPKE